MNSVFPSITTHPLSEIEPGAIVMLPRHNQVALALATDQEKGGIRSFVWLNARLQKLPIHLAEGWQVDVLAMRIDGTLRFELGMQDSQMDPRGRQWSELDGTIVCVGDQQFIRTAPLDRFADDCRLFNIRSGALLTTDLPRGSWTFGSWQLWLRDEVSRRDLQLMEFHFE